MPYPYGTPSSGLQDVFTDNSFTPSDVCGSIKDNVTSINRSAFIASLGYQVSLVQNMVNKEKLARYNDPITTGYFDTLRAETIEPTGCLRITTDNSDKDITISPYAYSDTRIVNNYGTLAISGIHADIDIYGDNNSPITIVGGDGITISSNDVMIKSSTFVHLSGLGIRTKSDMFPSSDNSFNAGSSTNRFAHVYGASGHFGGLIGGFTCLDSGDTYYVKDESIAVVMAPAAQTDLYLPEAPPSGRIFMAYAGNGISFMRVHTQGGDTINGPNLGGGNTYSDLGGAMGPPYGIIWIYNSANTYWLPVGESSYTV